ncbi:MAG: hypothetical protein LBN74_09480 [Prevotella sp.]|jgi:hypothetical protein|nr:hypothetical protein [Prevotella sp.]
MGNNDKEKYELVAKMTAKLVAEELADKNLWTLNEAISKLTKTSIYERVLDIDTKLWMDNPRDIAEMVMCELRGEKIPPSYFFK